MRELAGTDKDSDNRGVLAFLRKLPARQPSDMLRFFDRSSYYTLHGRDADTVAAEYFKSSACVKYSGSGEDRQPYLTVNKKMGAEIMRVALLQQKRRVEVYTSEGSSWVLERRGSPGNLQAFEEECLRDSDLSVDTSSVIAAVKLGRTTSAKGAPAVLVGCAFVDCTVRSIRVAEFEDDEHLSTLESLICQQGARECLLPPEQSENERAKLEDLAELCEVPSTVGSKKGAFAAKDVEQDLRRLVGKSELLNRAFTPSRLCLGATSGLISYLNLMENRETHGVWTMDWVDAAQFMRLDSGAMRALSVEPQPGDNEKSASLLGLFSVCKTAMGARLLRKWMKQPLLSRHDIEERYDIVGAFFQDYETRSLLRDEVMPKLGGDLEKLGRAFQAKKAHLKEVISLYYFVLGLPRLVETLHQHANLASSPEVADIVAQRFTSPLEKVQANFANLLRLVQSAMDMAAAQRHEYTLLPHFSPQLQSLSDERLEVVERIEGHYASLVRKFGLESDKVHLENDSRFGYCLRVTRQVEKELRACAAVKSGKVRLNQLQTKKDGVMFQDTQLASMAEEHAAVFKRYDAEQKALASKVIDTAATFGPVITECHTLLAELDVLLAFSHVASSAPEPFVRPTLVAPEDQTQRVVLRGCRHPCVERMEGVGFIKNDVELVRGKTGLQLVTGPNMGGKSTYIRSAGVNVLLAQVGSFVPCDEAEISITDCILARVGAGDCQSRGVSTFMAEMLETATILKSATAASLVIIDELGRGTSTYDGFGLAWAIAEHLATQVGCCTLFATHFHELTELASRHDAVVNRHVSAHIEEGAMTMLYKVADGPSDKAFGIHVAEAARFPASVVHTAKRKLAELEESELLPAKARAGSTAEAGAAVEPSVGTGGEQARTRPAVSEEERAEGLSQVRTLLASFRALPVDAMSREEASAALAKLTHDFAASTNPVVAAICKRGEVEAA